jgi:metallo-beta-lactamase class B
MLEEDWRLVEAGAGTNSNRVSGPPLKRDLVIKDGEGIVTGTTGLRVHRLPGHTPGSASFQFTVFDGGTPFKAFIFGGPGQRNGVEGGTQFLSSIERLQRQFADVDVAVHVHSWLATYPYPGGGVFERARTLAGRKAGEPHPFVDNAAWRQWLETAHAGTLKYIADAKAGRTK